MDEPTRLEHLRISIEGLEKLSDELAARSNNWHGSGEKLKPASALLAQYCEELRKSYEQLRDGQKTLDL